MRQPPAVLAGNCCPVGVAVFAGDAQNNALAAFDFENAWQGLGYGPSPTTIGQANAMAFECGGHGHCRRGACRLGIGVDVTGRKDGGAIDCVGGGFPTQFGLNPAWSVFIREQSFFSGPDPLAASALTVRHDAQHSSASANQQDFFGQMSVRGKIL